jgi:thiol:disulfide interchange protein
MAKCDFCNEDFSFTNGEGKQVIIEKTIAKDYKHEQLIMMRCNKCKDNKINISILGSKIHNDENPSLTHKNYVHNKLQEV